MNDSDSNDPAPEAFDYSHSDSNDLDSNDPDSNDPAPEGDSIDRTTPTSNDPDQSDYSHSDYSHSGYSNASSSDRDSDVGDLDGPSARHGSARPRSRPSGEAYDDWGAPIRKPRLSKTLAGHGRHLTAIAAVVLAAVAIVVGGSYLPVQVASTEVAAAPLVGRTSTVCPVAAQTGADANDQPNATVTAVAIRQSPDRQGVLTGTPLGGGDPLLTVDQQGFGQQVSAPPTPLLLQAVGVMSTASSSAILAQADSGELTGLSAAPCTAPSTSQWFVGVGAEATNRTELVLSNPDDAQAEVDLRFFGRAGRIVVPGSPGLIVPAHDSRTVSLESLVAQAGPMTVWVRATSGRVSAMARDFRSVGLDAAGVDWHPASVGPRRSLVVPGVPEGAGARELQLVNPGMTRAIVSVSVLGATGPFTPVGAEQVEVPPESTTTVSLDAGLAGQGAGIELSADRAVSASVISTSSRSTDTGSAAQPDIAVEPATAALGRQGVSPIAAVADTDGTLMLSNGAGTDTTVSFTVSNLSGVTVREGTILVPAHGTSTRNLDASDGPAYVEVDVPDDSEIHGAVDFAQTDGPVAGLTSLSVMSPDLAARSRVATTDPSVGR